LSECDQPQANDNDGFWDSGWIILVKVSYFLMYDILLRKTIQ